MQIACPHCQVKGKIKDDFIGKTVRCPKCEEIFIVEVDANTPPTTIETIAEVTTKIDEVTIKTPANDSSTEPNILITCSKCGFTYSEQFIVEKGEEKLCSVCAL